MALEFRQLIADTPDNLEYKVKALLPEWHLTSTNKKPTIALAKNSCIMNP